MQIYNTGLDVQFTIKAVLASMLIFTNTWLLVAIPAMEKLQFISHVSMKMAVIRNIKSVVLLTSFCSLCNAASLGLVIRFVLSVYELKRLGLPGPNASSVNDTVGDVVTLFLNIRDMIDHVRSFLFPMPVDRSRGPGNFGGNSELIAFVFEENCIRGK